MKSKEVGSGIGDINTATTNVHFTGADNVDINESMSGIIRDDYNSRGWDAGASTVEKLTGDGYFEFAAPYDNTWAIGLSYINPDHTMESVDYCIQSYYHGFKIFEKGVDQGIDLPAASVGSYRIARENNSIKYYYNDELVYTSPTPVEGDLLGDIALYKSDSENDSEVKIYNLHNEGDVNNLYNGYYTVEGIRVYDSGVMVKVNSDVNSELKTFGSINGNGKITWRRQWFRNSMNIHLDNTDDAGNNFLSVSSGNITIGVNGENTGNGRSSGSADIFSIERLDNKIIYRLNGEEFNKLERSSFGNLQAAVNFSSVGATIYSMEVENYTDFADYNKRTTYQNTSYVSVTDVGELEGDDTLPAGTLGGISTVETISGNGYLEIGPHSGKTWYAGLSHQDNGSGFESIEYCIAHYGADTSVAVYENGVDQNIQLPFLKSDHFKVERVGNQIYYKKNDTIFHTSRSPASGNLRGDISVGSEGIVLDNLQLYDYTLKKTFNQDEEYEQIVGLQVDTEGEISKTGQNNWQGELITKNTIGSNGVLRFSPVNPNSEFIAGLTTFNSVSKPFSVNYGLHFKTDGTMEVIANGMVTGSTFFYLSNDTFKLTRQENNIRIYKNDNLIYSASEAVFQPLIGKLSIYTQGGGVNYFTLEELQAEGALQTIDYTYNIRGWLTGINDPNNLGNDLLGFEIKYNKPTNDATPLFNGNISVTHWDSQSQNNTNNPVSNQYLYSYDALNRITEATDNTGNYNLSGISYDKMGNILSLQRQGQLDADITGFGAMDDLNYTYNNGNQLQQVDDFSNNLEGFNDGNPGIDYTYDPNGNLTSDANKGITHITYNHLNLPIDIEFNGSSSQTIRYTYDASGVKLRKEVPGKTTDYDGNYIYENSTLKQFSHPGGYVEPDGNGGYDYVYSYLDHLGNVRLNYSDLNGNGTIEAASEILDERNYYPFGLEHQGYNTNVISENNYQTFNGKELEKELGLEWTDYGARRYMKDLGRWTSVDPLADKYRDFSPYAYTANNPVLYIDPDGKRIIIGNNTKDALTKLAQIAATNYGRGKLDRLINSSRNYTMESVFWSSNSAYDSYGEIGKARTIYYPSSVWRFGIDGGDPGSTYVTGHEINHAYNHDSGFRLTKKQNEASSVRFGNYLRSVYGEDDMRTSYFGLGLSFSDNPDSYNSKKEKVSDFTETLNVEAGGSTFLGFSYEKGEGDQTSMEYIISVKTNNGTFAYRRFDNKKEYDAAVDRINKYQKEKEDEKD